MDASKISQTDDFSINPELIKNLNARELVPTTAWSAEQLKYLVENRLSMSMKGLSEHIGKSRASVAGKLSRLGLRAPKDFSRMMVSAGLKKAHSEGKFLNRKFSKREDAQGEWKPITTTHKKGQKAAPQHMVEPPVGILDGVGVKIWMLEHHHCKWVVGEPSNLTCCGQNRHPNSPYCQEHHQIAHKGKPNGQ